MKRFYPFFCIILLTLFFIVGCSTDPTSVSSKQDNIPFEDHHLYAVAYLGYLEMTDFDLYAEKYLDYTQLPIHHFSQGEYYLIIPRYSDMHLEFYKEDIATFVSTLIYEEANCKPFIIQCNISDIFPDATIKLTHNETTVEFSPYVSLENGSVKIGEKGLLLSL